MTRSFSPRKSLLLVVTDLDGTLLDYKTYSLKPALPALNILRKRNIPLIICSSKTRAEIEKIRKQLQNTHPFISENGGGIFIPKGYFSQPFSFTKEDSKYLIIELGTPYKKIREAFARIKALFSGEIKGFGDLSAAEVADLCGLSLEEAQLAKKREYDEPFLLDDESALDRIHEIASKSNLRITKGSRFYHLTGKNDKGRSMARLKRIYTIQGGPIKTIGLGDSQNDLPLLRTVDYPILVQKLDGSYNSSIQVDNLILASGRGPEGWNDALLKILLKS
ncbi:MAG: HAD-IIB family hydrolase [Candidatus Aminicenantales bacterium]